MSRSASQNGAALVATLAIVMILLPLGAFVAFQCRTDWLIHHNLRAEIESFYVAEAGLEHALAEIGPGQGFTDVLAGPDRVPGTADDGHFPFREGTVGPFPQLPFRYDVQVLAARPDMIQVTSQGSGRYGSLKIVQALVVRSPLPYTPGAVYAAGALSDFNLGTAGFLFSGFDHLIGDAPTAASGAAPPVPALAGASAEGLPSGLAGAAAQLVGAGGEPSIGTAPALDLAAYAAAAAARPNRVWLSGSVLAAETALGTRAAPQVSIVPGDLDVGAALTGCGVLVVQGVLHVTGTLAFSGVVVAMGGVVFEPSSTVTVTGALWSDSRASGRMEFRGHGAVDYSSAALAEVDTALPGLLPRSAVVVGWQEQL